MAEGSRRHNPNQAYNGVSAEQCQAMIQRSLQTPRVKVMMEHLEKAGCAVGEKFIRGVHCNKKVSGGYGPRIGIEVCCNHMIYQDNVNQVIIHELIHAYDECRAANLKWSNRAHQACSEIRASHLSGDCHFIREFLRGYIKKIPGHEQECVKRRVMKSIMSAQNCSEANARKAMESAWDVCYNDTKPFDRAP